MCIDYKKKNFIVENPTNILQLQSNVKHFHCTNFLFASAAINGLSSYNNHDFAIINTNIFNEKSFRKA